MRKKDTTKHDTSCLILQAVFFVVCIFFQACGVVGETLRLSGWFYFNAVAGWFGIGLILFAITINIPRVRHFFTLVFMMVNAFLIPSAVHATGSEEQVAALVGACYLIGVVVVATNDVALGAFMASGGFALLFHRLISGPGVEYQTTEYLMIVLSYLGLVAIAVGWRVVITRLYLLIKGKAPPGHVLEEEFDEVEDENRKFRKRIASYIVEMDKVTGHEPTLGKE